MKKTFFVLALALVTMFVLTLTMGCQSGKLYDPTLAISAVDGEYRNFSESIENAEEAVSKLPETTGVLALAEIKSVKRNAASMYSLCSDLGTKLNHCQRELTTCESDQMGRASDIKRARSFGFYLGITVTFAAYTALIAAVIFIKTKFGSIFTIIRKFLP